MRVARARVLRAPAADVWRVAGEPAQLARWWPGVERVEAAGPAGFTQVHRTRRGRTVRADFRIVSQRAGEELVFEQELEGTPFERLLSRSLVAIAVTPEEAGTRVELAVEQDWRGVQRLGLPLVRRGARRRLDQALDGLARAA